MPHKPKIVISMGDPAGVGAEIILKALSKKSVASKAQYLIIGYSELFEQVRERIKAKVSWEESSTPEFLGKVTLWQPPCCTSSSGKIPMPGKWTKGSGKSSFGCVTEAVKLCMSDKADALVTAPICKAAWHKAGCDYPGHTELLAELTNTKRMVMMLTGGGLRVGLVTIHEQLAKVPWLLDRSKITANARIMDKSLRKFFGINKPRIAILGINPHAGEEGHMGDEEVKIIAPAISNLRRRGIDAIGPLPADTAFHNALKGEYDAILAMYHDQGLGPLKTIAFDTGVNITLGLPIIRTSPDHGTAFDIAGTNQAKPDSMIEAIKTAIEMSSN